jgi:DNA-binding MarR family transcriptional regulator
LGVSPPRLSALSVVMRAGPITIGDLAAAENVRPPTMTRLVDGLEHDGLVTREPHPDDRRSVRVRVTAKGKRVLTGGRTRRTRSLAEHLRDLAPDDLETLSRATDLLERTIRETRD